MDNPERSTPCRLCGLPLPPEAQRCPSCGMPVTTELPRRAFRRLLAGLAAVYLLTALALLFTR